MRGPARIAPAAPSTARPATSTRRAWAASVTAAWSLLSVRTAVAQMTGTVDLGVSTVHYDGFLPSGAAAVTPVLRWDRPAGMLTASGTYLRFESGHRSLQGLLAGSFLTPPAAHAWLGEFAASAGASRYLDFASFWHVVAEARLHRLGAERGLWVGGTAGTTSYGTAPRPVIAADVGVWARRSEVTLRLAVNHAQVGDTTYTDLESSAHAGRGPVALEAKLGARVWSRGGGRGVYGEGSATIWVGGRTAFVISGGRYATDPISGSITGRYLSAALRVRTAAPRRAFPREPAVRMEQPSCGRPGSRCTPTAIGRCGSSCGSPALRSSRSPETSPIGSLSPWAAPAPTRGRSRCRCRAACIGSTCVSTVARGSYRPARREHPMTTAATLGSS